MHCAEVAEIGGVLVMFVLGIQRMDEEQRGENGASSHDGLLGKASIIYQFVWALTPRVESGPIHTLNFPRRVSVNVTRLLSPGARAIRWNPFSSFSGRETLATGSPM